uniref:VWFA domain-containing protein n=1 Tax=Sus scrofa TaxID=9823 RepID=A0A8D1RFY4_PIG
MVKKYTNPRLRMSFITYSTQGNTIMKLTSNRNVIKNSLKRLRNIVPKGARNMQEGLKKANEQIYKVQSSNFGASSLIFTLTAGPLQPSAVQETKQEADKARRMKAKVYCIGMKDYKAYQLNKFIEAKTHFFNMEQIEDQKRLIASIVGNSCVELMAKDTYYVCVGNDYSLEFYTYGLEPEKIGEYSCRYKLDETEVFCKCPAWCIQVIYCPHPLHSSIQPSCQSPC